MEKTITPSIICYPGDVSQKADVMNALNCSRIHLDIVNGNKEVPDFFKYPDLTEKDRNLFNGAIDFHIFDYKRSFEYQTLPYRAQDRVIIHIFPDMNVHTVKKAVESTKKQGYLVGLALDLETELNTIIPFVQEVDTILIMGIKIGGRKLPLSEKAINSIKCVKKELALANKKIAVGIDGGVNIYTFDMLLNLTDYIIVGSLLFNDDDLSQKWSQFGYSMLLTSPISTYVKHYRGVL